MAKCKLPGLLDDFDAIDIVALVVLLFILVLASFGDISLDESVVKIIIYTCLGTLFGTKAVKGARK